MLSCRSWWTCYFPFWSQSALIARFWLGTSARYYFVKFWTIFIYRFLYETFYLYTEITPLHIALLRSFSMPLISLQVVICLLLRKTAPFMNYIQVSTLIPIFVFMQILVPISFRIFIWFVISVSFKSFKGWRVFKYNLKRSMYNTVIYNYFQSGYWPYWTQQSSQHPFDSQNKLFNICRLLQTVTCVHVLQVELILLFCLKFDNLLMKQILYLINNYLCLLHSMTG